jgi:hypothetical protein
MLSGNNVHRVFTAQLLAHRRRTIRACSRTLAESHARRL